MKALKCYFSIRDEENIISFKYASSSVLVLRCTLYLRPRFYLEKAKAILLYMTTGVPFLQYLQQLWSDVVNVCKGKTIQWAQTAEASLAGATSNWYKCKD